MKTSIFIMYILLSRKQIWGEKKNLNPNVSLQRIIYIQHFLASQLCLQESQVSIFSGVFFFLDSICSDKYSSTFFLSGLLWTHKL